MITEGQINLNEYSNEKENINISIVCPIQEFDSELGTSFNSTTTSNIPEFLGKEEEEWLAGRSLEHYPKDENLPWHTCFIDDGMIGGCSAPVKRYHWKAMRDAGVGLVVNLTERPIFPNAKAQASCMNCDFFEEEYDDDIFDDLDDGDIEVLFLPVQDGSIPRWEQLDIFQKEADYTISRGKKVLVHCQAGVGRTGTFLAIYLMDKYQCTASEAIEKLRFIRPQSLQFDKHDWQKNPFKFSAQESYSRNFIQERFIEVYHEARIRKKRFNSISELMEGVSSSVEEAIGQGLVAVVDGELESRLKIFEENATKAYFEFEEISKACFVCESILYVGPELVKRGLKKWPS